MKGVVFTEFMEMVEAKFGEEMVDDLIEATNPESGAAYTAVGTYNYIELINMVQELSKRADIPVPKLINTFGRHLASVFTSKFPSFFEEEGNTTALLKRIDNHIHVEVAKLYPDAELPKFSYEESASGEFHLYYSSTRGLADLAEGLIQAVAEYYQESFELQRQDSEQDGVQHSHFVLTAV